MFVNKILLTFVFSVVLLELHVKANVVTRNESSTPKHQYGSPLNILGFEQIDNDIKVVVDNNALDEMFLHPEV